MGHSEGIALQQVHPAPDGAGTLADDVRVWGDVDKARLAANADPASHGSNPDLYHRIGNLTRTLHDALRELGYHESLAVARDNLPDARDRLSYVARLTGQAAEKVLNSVDRARSIQDETSEQAKDLRTRWGVVAAYTAAESQRATPAGRALVEETRRFLESLSERAERTNAILTEIMMAQDFHDLTGQVIRRIIGLSQELEEQLVQLLIEATPQQQRHRLKAPAELEGPVVNPDGRTDVVTDQAAVDDLLASLGF